MSDKMLYIETVSHESLNLPEDIVRLQIAKKAISDLSMTGRIMPDPERIDKDEQYKVINMINGFERKLRSALRDIYLEPRGKKVYDSLRNRIKDELKKEGAFDENLREC